MELHLSKVGKVENKLKFRSVALTTERHQHLLAKQDVLRLNPNWGIITF